MKKVFLISFLLVGTFFVSAQQVPNFTILGSVGEATQNNPMILGNSIVTYGDGIITIHDASGESVSLAKNHQGIIFIKNDELYFHEDGILYRTNEGVDYFIQVMDLALEDTEYLVTQNVANHYLIPTTTQGNLIKFNGYTATPVIGIFPTHLDPINWVEEFDGKILLSFKWSGLFLLEDSNLNFISNFAFSNPSKITEHTFTCTANDMLQVFDLNTGTLSPISNSQFLHVLKMDSILYGVFPTWHEQAGQYIQYGSMGMDLSIRAEYPNIQWGNLNMNRPSSLMNFPGTDLYLGSFAELRLNGDTEYMPEGMYLLEKQGTTVSTTGVEGDIKLTIFPNPATDLINIELPSEIVDQINIYNVNGQSFGEFKGHIRQFDVSSLLPGTYYLQILLTDRTSVTRKFLKK